MLLFTTLFGGLMLLSMEKPAPHDCSFADRLHRNSRGFAATGTSSVLPAVCDSGGAGHHQPDHRQLAECNQRGVSDIRNLYEQTIWPISAINLAKAQIQSIIARFRGVIQSIMTINPHTATLPNPAPLRTSSGTEALETLAPFRRCM
jgi:hypothetical protein